MCYFVTVGVRPGEIDALKPFRDGGFDVSRARNDSLATAFGSDYAAFHVTIGGCSCDLRSSTEDVRAKYRRKGWSPSKVERALKNRERAGERAGAAARFLEAFRALSNDATDVLVFGHWYSREVDDERVTPRGRVRLSVNDYLAAGDPSRDDELLEIRSRK